MTEIYVKAPCDFVSANKRYHHMAKANLTKQWRHAGFVAARGMEPMPTPVRIVAHIFKPRRGRFDPNNLADTTKAVVDGFVEAGLLVDDSFDHVQGPDHRYGGKGEPGIVFTFEPMEAVWERLRADLRA